MNCQHTLALMAYRLCCPGPMYQCITWLSGNILGIDAHVKKLSSQAISRLLVDLGDETVQRKFFKSYLQDGSLSAKNVIIDATSLPNQIHSDFNAWGYMEILTLFPLSLAEIQRRENHFIKYALDQSWPSHVT